MNNISDILINCSYQNERVQMKNKYNLILIIVQMSYLAGFSTFFNFLVLFMSENGYTTLECGMAQALTAGVTVIAGPIFGHIADKFLSYKKIVVIGLLCASVTTFLIPMTINYFFIAMISIVFHSAFIRQFPTLIDSWTVAMRRKEPNINYGLTRGFGSIGEGIAAFTVGYLIVKMGFISMFICHSILLIIALIGSMFLFDIKAENSSKLKKNSLYNTFKELLKNRYFVTFAMSVFFLNVGLKVVSIFASIMVERLGGNSYNFGFIMFVCGLFEFPTFIIMSKLSKKVKIPYLYLVGIATFAIGSLLAITAKTMVIFLIGRTLTSITYSIYLIVMVEYVDVIVNKNIKTTAMGIIAALVSGLAHIVSSLLGGYILDYSGIKTMIMLFVIIFVMTLGIFIPNLKNTLNIGKQ